jgi:hypothetical protein
METDYKIDIVYSSVNNSSSILKLFSEVQWKEKRNMSKESGAISLLKRAVELDSRKQWTSALVCYKEGLQMLMEVKKF